MDSKRNYRRPSTRRKSRFYLWSEILKTKLGLHSWSFKKTTLRNKMLMSRKTCVSFKKVTDLLTHLHTDSHYDVQHMLMVLTTCLIPQFKRCNSRQSFLWSCSFIKVYDNFKPFIYNTSSQTFLKCKIWRFGDLGGQNETVGLEIDVSKSPSLPKCVSGYSILLEPTLIETQCINSRQKKLV